MLATTFHAGFPGGNGALLGCREDGAHAEIRFAAEPKNCPQAMWFHFNVRGVAGRTARFILANPEQTLGGGDWSGNRPVFRAGPAAPDHLTEWKRLPPPTRLDVDARVEWAWDIELGWDEVELAHCFPYQPADLESTLAELGGAFRSTAIGVTPGNRPLPRVFSGLAEKDKPGVYLTVRHHAGETPGSWALDGLLRRVAAEKRLRERIVWWAVPFVDLDDVVGGSYGKDPWPHDCNRAYGPGGPRRPEAAAIEPDCRRLKEAGGRMFFCDIHAPAHAEQQNYVPLRNWDLDSVPDPVAEEFANLYLAAQPEDIRSPTAHITPARQMPRVVGMSSSDWAREVLKVEAVSLEISYQGNGRKYYDIDDYRRLGAALADAVADWLLRRPQGREQPAK